MLNKYLVSVDSIAVGIIYDDVNLELRIGGNRRFDSFMQALIINYAGLDITEAIQKVDRSKWKYKIHCTKENYQELLKNLELQCIPFVIVETLGRIMR